MGQGTKTIFPQLVGEALGVPDDDVEIAPQDTAYVPDSGPTVASRTAMVVGGLLIKAARRLREQVEAATGGTFAETYRDLRPRPRRDPHRPAVRAVPGRHAVRRRDLHRRRLPGLRLGGLRRPRRRRPRHRRGPRPRRRRRRRHRPGHPPGPGRGPGRGRHAAGRRLRDDRGDQAARRPLPQRPPRDVHHPDRARRAAHRDDPRRGAVQRGARTAPRASASCRWTSARRPSSRRSPTRPGSGSRTCRPARSGSSRRSPGDPSVAGPRPAESEPARDLAS